MNDPNVKRNKTNLFGLVRKRLLSWKAWITPIHTRSILPIKGQGTEKNKKRSVFIRCVDGGSSNAEELEIANLFNPLYDLAQYGFQLVASPRHADLLLISGPLTNGMRPALLDTFMAMSEPRRVVTLGDSLNPDSPFASSYAVVPLPAEVLAACVAHIPGNPPAPRQIIRVLLSLNL